MNFCRDDVRRKSGKFRFEPNQLRTNRIVEVSEARKRSRDDLLTKQRSISNEDSQIDSVAECIEMMEIDKVPNASTIKEFWINQLNSAHEYQQQSAAWQIHGQLTRTKSRTIEEIFKLNLLRRFVDLLLSKNQSTALKAAQILVVISEEKVESHLPPDAISKFVQLLKSNAKEYVKEQILFMLSNIVVESSTLRESVLASGVLPTVCHIMEGSVNDHILLNGVWLLNELCSESSHITEKLKSLPILTKMLYYSNLNIVSQACFALSGLSRLSESVVETIVAEGCCKHIVMLLGHNTTKTAALHLTRRIAGTSDQAKSLVDHDVLPVLHLLMSEEDMLIVKDACWTLSCIAGGPTQHIQAIIDEGIFPKVLSLNSDGSDTQLHAVWIVRTCLSVRRTTAEQASYFLSIGFIPVLCKLLTTSNRQTLVLALQSLHLILQIGSRDGPNELNFCFNQILQHTQGKV